MKVYLNDTFNQFHHFEAEKLWHHYSHEGRIFEFRKLVEDCAYYGLVEEPTGLEDAQPAPRNDTIVSLLDRKGELAQTLMVSYFNYKRLRHVIRRQALHKGNRHNLPRK